MRVAESVQPAVAVTPLVCQECGSVWVESKERWRVYLSDDSPPLPVPYCPVCAREEFGYRQSIF
jgi:hypothetical protein